MKQLKKLWESESELTQGKTKLERMLNLSESIRSFNEFKKWSSMHEIVSEPPVYDSCEVHVPAEPVEPKDTFPKEPFLDIKVSDGSKPQIVKPPAEATVDNETRSNMSNVLEEIKRLDQNKAQYLQSKPKRIELDKMQAMNLSTVEKVGHNSRMEQHSRPIENNSHLVKKLKQKFDNKDQSFVKVASLTCRNASTKETSSRNKLPNSSVRPTMLSVCENSSTNEFDHGETRRAASTSINSKLFEIEKFFLDFLLLINFEGDRLNEEIIRRYKETKTRSISSSSSSSSYGSSFIGGGFIGGSFGGGLYSCVSSTSSAVTSGLGSSEHTPTFTRPYFYKHMITSRKSFNHEIKNLLDIAENKTRVLCKVYDSSMSEETSTTSASNTNSICMPSEKPFSRANDSKQIFPKDYRKIIDINYSNLRKKQSNVLNKVKLWDQLLESGSLNIASWGKSFFEFS